MIEIRKIEMDDYEQVIEMIKTTIMISFHDLYPELLKTAICEKYDLESFIVSAKEIEMWVAKENDNIVGIIGLQENRVRTFYVHPEKQGKGIGKNLYKKLEETALARGATNLFVISSPIGESIYEHFGFQKIKPVEKERAGQKYVDILMEKYF